MKHECPYCGSDELLYLGVDDGGGDYGDALIESYQCLDCEGVIEFGFSFDDEPYPQSDAARAVSEFLAEDEQRGL